MRAGFAGTSGTGFTLDGISFPVAGANCYYLAFAPPDKPHVIESALDLAGDLSVNVLRIWGFLDLGESADVPPRGQWGACFQYLKTGTGVVQVSGPDGLDRLDRAVVACAERGIKVIVALSNSLPDYGGADQYLKWVSPAGTSRAHDDFFIDEAAAEVYERWVSSLLNREVGNTGRAYKDEPAVMAWELMNEPRCTVRGRITAWAARMSAFIKAIDPDHLVGVGDEGFFSRSISCSDLHNGGYGVDCEALLSVPSVDFGTYHMYPQAWRPKDPGFATRWIRQHRRIARRAGKPVLLEEFGLGLRDGVDAASRDEAYAHWMQQSLTEDGAGALLWMLAGLNPEGNPYGGDEFSIRSAAESPMLAERMHARRG